MNKIASAILLAAGIVLIGFGISATNSFSFGCIAILHQLAHR